MRRATLALLRRVVRERELSYRAVPNMLPKRFGDHRDFYSLASLYCAGYIGATVHHSSKPDEPDPNLFMASYFYAMTRGEGSHRCNTFTAKNDAESDLRNFVFASAKADLYISERIEKRTDRLVSLGLGMVLAVFSSWFALWLRSRFGG